MPKVKCLYCGEQLERDSEECVKVNSRRYAHVTCVKKLSQEEEQQQKDQEKLKGYINELFGKDANWALITKQIKQYLGQGMTYSGIFKSLKYFYEIKKNDKKKSNGNIAIVPFIYQQAYIYYYDMWLRQEQNKNAGVEPLRVVEVTIRPPASRRKVKLFDLGGD